MQDGASGGRVSPENLRTGVSVSGRPFMGKSSSKGRFRERVPFAGGCGNWPANYRRRDADQPPSLSLPHPTSTANLAPPASSLPPPRTPKCPARSQAGELPPQPPRLPAPRLSPPSRPAELPSLLDSAHLGVPHPRPLPPAALTVRNPRPAWPARRASPALPDLPACPASPALPELPALPAMPALPALPPLESFPQSPWS
jgi:hypothetical protein